MKTISRKERIATVISILILLGLALAWAYLVSPYAMQIAGDSPSMVAFIYMPVALAALGITSIILYESIKMASGPETPNDNFKPGDRKAYIS